MTTPRLIKPCRRCGTPTRPGKTTGPEPARAGRGLCTTCYTAAFRDGTLVDYPRVHKPRADVLEDWQVCRQSGDTIAAAARRMGMTRDALDQALRRARRAGEEVAA